MSVAIDRNDFTNQMYDPIKISTNPFEFVLIGIS